MQNIEVNSWWEQSTFFFTKWRHRFKLLEERMCQSRIQVVRGPCLVKLQRPGEHYSQSTGRNQPRIIRIPVVRSSCPVHSERNISKCQRQIRSKVWALWHPAEEAPSFARPCKPNQLGEKKSTQVKQMNKKQKTNKQVNEWAGTHNAMLSNT